jgi:hypothetical protein
MKLRMVIAVLVIASFAIGQQAPPAAPKQDDKPATRALSGEDKVKFTFEDAAAGATPKGWTAAETNGGGTPAKWQVESLKDDPKHKNVVKVDTKNKEAVFNMLLTDKIYPADLSLSVSIKSGSGEDDQGGGLVWRAKDANNYYIARWNPLEKNFRLYKVEGAKRTTLKSAELEADAKTWHAITVKHKGSAISVEFDGKEVLAAEDATFKDAGKIGLWTKADASSWFDDVEVSKK